MRPGTSNAGRRVVDSFATAGSVAVCLIQKDIWVQLDSRKLDVSELFIRRVQTVSVWGVQKQVASW